MEDAAMTKQHKKSVKNTRSAVYMFDWTPFLEDLRSKERREKKEGGRQEKNRVLRYRIIMGTAYELHSLEKARVQIYIHELPVTPVVAVCSLLSNVIESITTTTSACKSNPPLVQLYYW